MEQGEEQVEEIFKLLNIDPKKDWTEQESSEWITPIEKLHKVAGLLEERHAIIPEGSKELIANRVRDLESACDKVLQFLPQHRITRGRTREVTAGRNTESGYDSTSTSAVLSTSSAVLSMHENSEKTFVQPSPNGSSELVTTNGCKKVVEALQTFVQPSPNGSSELVTTNGCKKVVEALQRGSSLENQSDAATNRNPGENEETH